jgi:hypothetical protein
MFIHKHGHAILNWSNLQFQITCLHYEVKLKLLLELCVENFKTCDGFMNGVNQNFNIILKNQNI